jgi:hypothetical protein
MNTMEIFPFKEKSSWQNGESNPGPHDQWSETLVLSPYINKTYFQLRHFVEINSPAATKISSRRIGHLILRKQLSSIGSPVCQTNTKQVLLAFLFQRTPHTHRACGPLSGLQTGNCRTFFKMPQLSTGDRCHAVTILGTLILVFRYSGKINYNSTILYLIKLL